MIRYYVSKRCTSPILMRNPPGPAARHVKETPNFSLFSCGTCHRLDWLLLHRQPQEDEKIQCGVTASTVSFLPRSGATTNTESILCLRGLVARKHQFTDCTSYSSRVAGISGGEHDSKKRR